MNILLNKQQVAVPDGLSLCTFLQSQGIVQSGIAVAVNNRVIPKTIWAETMMNEADEVIVITAAFGG